MLNKDIKDIVFLKKVIVSFIDEFVLNGNELVYCQSLLSVLNSYVKVYDTKYKGTEFYVKQYMNYSASFCWQGPYKFNRIEMLNSLYSSTASTGFFISYKQGIGSSIAHIDDIKFI